MRKVCGRFKTQYLIALLPYIVEMDRNKSSARSTSIDELLVKYMDDGEIMQLSKAGAAKRMWRKWAAAAWKNDKGLPKAMKLTITDNRCMPTGEGAQCVLGTKNANICKIANPGTFCCLWT